MDVLTSANERRSRRSPRRWAMALLAAVVLAAIGETGVDGQSAATTLGVPGRTNAHVSLAAEGEFVVAAWAASLPSGVTDVFVAVSRDAGLTFGTPTRVNSEIGDARINGEQPPRVAVRDGGLVAAIPASRSSGLRRVRRARRYCWVDPPILASRSRGPRLFREPMRLATAAGRPSRRIEGGPARHVARPSRAGRGRHRQTGGRHAQSRGHGTVNGPLPRRRTRPMVSPWPRNRSSTSACLLKLTTATAPRPITGGVCYCCKTALAVGRPGSVFAAWRHVYPGNLRDIAFSMSRDGGRTYSDRFGSTRISGS